jgi:hypothetical protein
MKKGKEKDKGQSNGEREKKLQFKHTSTQRRMFSIEKKVKNGCHDSFLLTFSSHLLFLFLQWLARQTNAKRARSVDGQLTLIPREDGGDNF